MHGGWNAAVRSRRRQRGDAMFYVYEHWRPDINECFYVGKGSGNRGYDMWNRNRDHNQVQMELAKQHLGIEVRIVFVSDVESIIYAMEEYIIQRWRSSGNSLIANLRKGGGSNSGWKHNEESKKRMSESRKGRKRPEISGDRHPCYGKKFGIHLIRAPGGPRKKLADEFGYWTPNRLALLERMRKNPPVLGKRWKLSGEALANNISGKKKMWETRRANAARGT